MNSRRTGKAVPGVPFRNGDDSRRNMNGPLCKEALTLRAEFTRAIAKKGRQGKRFEKVVDMIWRRAEAGVPYFVGIIVDLFAEKQAQQIEFPTGLDIRVQKIITHENPRE